MWLQRPRTNSHCYLGWISAADIHSTNCCNELKVSSGRRNEEKKRALLFTQMQKSSFHFRRPGRHARVVTLTVCPLHEAQWGCLARRPCSRDGAGCQVWVTACLAISLTLVINGQAKLLAPWAAFGSSTVSNQGQYSSYKAQMQPRAASTHRFALPFSCSYMSNMAMYRNMSTAHVETLALHSLIICAA